MNTNHLWFLKREHNSFYTYRGILIFVTFLSQTSIRFDALLTLSYFARKTEWESPVVVRGRGVFSDGSRW